MAKKLTAEECLAKCEKEIAALKKEIAGLKKELSKAKGGANPKLEKLLLWMKNRNANWAKELENLKI